MFRKLPSNTEQAAKPYSGTESETKVLLPVLETNSYKTKWKKVLTISMRHFPLLLVHLNVHVWKFPLIRTWTSSRRTTRHHYLHPGSHVGPQWLMGLTNKENHGISLVWRLEKQALCLPLSLFFYFISQQCVVTLCQGASDEWYLVWLLTAPLGEENKKRWR